MPLRYLPYYYFIRVCLAFLFILPCFRIPLLFPQPATSPFNIVRPISDPVPQIAWSGFHRERLLLLLLGFSCFSSKFKHQNICSASFLIRPLPPRPDSSTHASCHRRRSHPCPSPSPLPACGHAAGNHGAAAATERPLRPRRLRSAARSASTNAARSTPPSSRLRPSDAVPR